MSKGFADFLNLLNREGVRYVVTGRMALLSLIPYRTTRDLDVLIEPTLENARRVRAAVRSWSGAEPRFTEKDFISGDILSFGGLLPVDVHSKVSGVDWGRYGSGVWKANFWASPLNSPHWAISSR